VFRLTREVRFSLTGRPAGRQGNGHGGAPAIDRIAPWLALRVTLCGDLNDRSSYLQNIKDIDKVVRDRAIPLLNAIATDETASHRLADIPAVLAGALKDGWPGATLDKIELSLSPYCTIGVVLKELPMTRLSQKFEFSAAHRLHNPAISDDENIQTYGKCNNPHGHGHNYEVEVTIAGTPDSSGLILAVHDLERIVNQAVIQKLDHKHLNVEVPEFKQLIPSVENIAMVIYRMLKPLVANARATLASVTVWETPKTWCEYSE